jgi:hypothetical protein
MEVGVENLEKYSPVEVQQEFQWHDMRSLSGKDYMPLFEVKWGKWDRPRVEVEIDGRSEALLSLRVEDDTVSLRPLGLMKNRDDLLKISDEEFSGYTEQRRSEVVSMFSGIKYDLGAERAGTPASNSISTTNEVGQGNTRNGITGLSTNVNASGKSEGKN